MIKIKAELFGSKIWSRAEFRTIVPNSSNLEKRPSVTNDVIYNDHITWFGAREEFGTLSQNKNFLSIESRWIDSLHSEM